VYLLKLSSECLVSYDPHFPGNDGTNKGFQCFQRALSALGLFFAFKFKFASCAFLCLLGLGLV
jgi:hypothetical protein